MTKVEIPTFDTLMNPLILVLKDLGGSGTIEEIDSKVAEVVGLSDDQLEVLHDPNRGGQTEFEYRKVVRRKVQEQRKKTPIVSQETEEEETSWRDELVNTLQAMEPSAFERLVQRLLREAGFFQVEVTGRSGDGGIDGKGIMRLGGMLSFHVIFQCKRYQGSVTPSQIRDFRGAMVGRADKGLFITTGNFTKEATREATRDGAPAIDLIDGDQLVEKLKEFELGVRTKKVEVEQITIDSDWFAHI